MGHQNNEVDVESQQESGRRRNSCLDMFLVMSVFFLFAAVTAVAVGGLLTAVDLRSKLKPSTTISEYETLKQTDTTTPAYKMKNFAYLQAIQSQLNNSTMQWEPVPYGEGTSLGSNFYFDPNQHSLKPEQKGTYFMYINLKFNCTFRCSAGVLSVRVGDKLTCEVQLPAQNPAQLPAHSRPVSKKCWTVSHLDPEGLLAQMTVSKGLEQYWKLDLKGSGFGMFLVD